MNRSLLNIIKSYSTNQTKNVIELSINSSGIAKVSFNNPPVNALSMSVLQGLRGTFDNLQTDKSCRGAILTSSLSTVFCAGLDIKELTKPDITRLKLYWTELQDAWLQVYAFTKPLVAVINGHSPAGGCLFSCGCDYRIMSNNYKIGLNEVELAIPVPFWVGESMRSAMGRRKTELALASADLYKTEEAFTLGLVDQVVVDKEEGLLEAERQLQKWFKVESNARGLTKTSLRQRDIDELKRRRHEDVESSVKAISSDAAQGVIEKYLKSLKKK